LTSSDWSDWTYNRNNELTSYDSVVYDYDANGNTTKKTAGGQVTNYAYDIDNRLIKITRGDGSTVAGYYYDMFGRRLSKTVGGTTTCYLYSDEGLVGKYTATGTEIKTYGYEPNSTWVTNPLFQKVGANYYWYQNDHLGTPQKMVDGTGRIVWAATYDAFGKATVTTSEIENNLRFPGQYYDAETGYHYNWHRYYDPGTGRYVTTDPIGLEGGINLRIYAGNNPIQSFDPFGLETFICTAPLHALGPKWGPKLYDPSWHNWLYHEYVCVRDISGKVTCGGLDRSGNAVWSKGIPSSDKWPEPGKGSCEKKDDRECVDTCALKKIGSTKRPRYGIGWQGTDCQEWADDVVRKCKSECRNECREKK
jgi:RHS repeat-associated protein